MRIDLVFTQHLRQHDCPPQEDALIASSAFSSTRGSGARWARPAARVLFLGAVVGALAACASLEPTVPAEPGVTFSLAVGKTATINGSGARITFHRVRDDSRCPTDVQCVWAGDARIEVTISRSGAPDDPKVLGLNPPNNEATSGDLRIRFVGLTPVPRTSDKTPREYVAQLVVNRP